MKRRLPFAAVALLAALVLELHQVSLAFSAFHDYPLASTATLLFHLVFLAFAVAVYVLFESLRVVRC